MGGRGLFRGLVMGCGMGVVGVVFVEGMWGGLGCRGRIVG